MMSRVAVVTSRVAVVTSRCHERPKFFFSVLPRSGFEVWKIAPNRPSDQQQACIHSRCKHKQKLSKFGKERCHQIGDQDMAIIEVA